MSDGVLRYQKIQDAHHTSINIFSWHIWYHESNVICWNSWPSEVHSNYSIQFSWVIGIDKLWAIQYLKVGLKMQLFGFAPKCTYWDSNMYLLCVSSAFSLHTSKLESKTILSLCGGTSGTWSGTTPACSHKQELGLLVSKITGKKLKYFYMEKKKTANLPDLHFKPLIKASMSSPLPNWKFSETE